MDIMDHFKVENIQTRIVDTFQTLQSSSNQLVASQVVNHRAILKKVASDQLIEKLLANKNHSLSFVSGILSTGILFIITSFLYKLFHKSPGSNTAKSGASEGKTKKKKKKKTKSKKAVQKSPEPQLSPEQKVKTQVASILNEVNTEIVPRIHDYETNLNKTTPSADKKEKDNLNYSYLYLEETLLKQLMKLDTIDHFGDESLRLERKNAIKYVQQLHKKIDLLKKDHLNKTQSV